MKYNKETAKRLVLDMQSYENEILSSAKEACSAAKASFVWKDKKHDIFCKELSNVMQDIKNGAYTIRDYRNHLNKKIHEME